MRGEWAGRMHGSSGAGRAPSSTRALVRSYQQLVCCISPAAIQRLASATPAIRSFSSSACTSCSGRARRAREGRARQDVHAALEGRARKDVHAALEEGRARSAREGRALEKDEKCCWRSRLAARARAASQTPHVRTQGFPGGRVPSMHAECCSKFVRSCARAVLIFLPCMHAECCFVRSCVHACSTRGFVRAH